MTKSIKTENKPVKHNPEDIRRKISDAAYFLSMQRGFEGDYQLHDWLEAEAKVHHKYGKG